MSYSDFFLISDMNFIIFILHITIFIGKINISIVSVYSVYRLRSSIVSWVKLSDLTEVRCESSLSL